MKAMGEIEVKICLDLKYGHDKKSIIKLVAFVAYTGTIVYV